MKHIFQKLILLFFIFATTNHIYAWWPFNACQSECDTTCRQYECSCNPLQCGSFDLQFQAGVSPINWRHGSEVETGFFNVQFPSPTLKVIDHFHFNDFFHVPWIIGGQVGYAWSDNVRFYIDLNYLQAKAKNFSSISLTNPGLPVALVPGKYRLFDVYFGGRYYWNRWCDRVSFFVGAKIGLTSHKSTDFMVTIAVPQLPSTTFLSDIQIFNHRTGISGGINGGIDICFCGNWAFVITGEIVISRGPKVTEDLILNPSVLNFTTLSFAPIGAEIRFPVTAAIRYTF